MLLCRSTSVSHVSVIGQTKIRPGDGRYLFRGVMVGDGHRGAGTSLRAAQDEAGVPPGIWKGRGLAAVGLTAGDVVTERQAELLLGEGRHSDADRIERERLAQGESPGRARRATVLGRPIEHNRSPQTDKAKERVPWLRMHLVARPPPTAHIAWALMGHEIRLVLELCQDIVRDGLTVAVFRHYESGAAESKPSSTIMRWSRSVPSTPTRRGKRTSARSQFGSHSRAYITVHRACSP